MQGETIQIGLDNEPEILEVEQKTSGIVQKYKMGLLKTRKFEKSET